MIIKSLGTLVKHIEYSQPGETAYNSQKEKEKKRPNKDNEYISKDKQANANHGKQEKYFLIFFNKEQYNIEKRREKHNEQKHKITE